MLQHVEQGHGRTVAPLVPWVVHTEVGQCFGRSCWHQMTRLTKLAPLRRWWRKWRRQDGGRVRIQKWRETQLTGNVSARHQNSKKAHFTVSYLYSAWWKWVICLCLQCLWWPEVNISMDIITFWSFLWGFFWLVSMLRYLCSTKHEHHNVKTVIS